MFDDRDVGNAYYEFIKAQAKVFVEAHWDDIEGIARELVEHGTLTTYEVRATMLRDATSCPQWLREGITAYYGARSIPCGNLGRIARSACPA